MMRKTHRGSVAWGLQSVVLALVNDTPASRATRLKHGDHVTVAATS